MFDLYFGALDLFLYGAAFFVSLALSRALTEEVELLQPVLVSSGSSAAARVATPVVQTVAASVALPVRVVKVSDVQTDDKAKHSSFEDAKPSNVGDTALSFEEAVESRVDDVTDSDDSNDKPVLNLCEVRQYKLRKQPVVQLNALPSTITLPDTIRRYKLRGKPVVQISALENFFEVKTC